LLHVLALIIPLGFAAAVSPVMLTEQTVVLAGPNGRRSGIFYAIGAVATMAVFIAILLLFGHSISLPKEPHLDSTLDIVVGALLIALGTFIRLRRPTEKVEKPPRGEMDARAALAFGVVSMMTNFTTLALVIPAAKEISSSHLNALEGVVVALVLLALSSIPAWVPVALTAIAPGPAERGLHAIRDFIARSGRLATVVLLVLVGAFFVVRGIARLAG
jgi:threonine/homoserine/homoserine lactone efflux protein